MLQPITLLLEPARGDWACYALAHCCYSLLGGGGFDTLSLLLMDMPKP